MWLFSFFWLVPLLVAAGAQLLNVTLDDTSTSIKYTGNWEPSASHLSGLDYGGSHTLSSDASATATLVFTGVAVYYLSPRWPYAVSSKLSIDGSPPQLVNLTNPTASPTAPGGSEDTLSAVVWSATNLQNTTHTVVVSYGNYVIVDGFIYTQDNPVPPPAPSSAPPIISSLRSSSATTSSQTSSASASETPVAASSSTRHSRSKGLPIGLGIALATLGILSAVLVAFWYRRQNKRAYHSTKPQMTIAGNGWDKPQGGMGGPYNATVPIVVPAVTAGGLFSSEHPASVYSQSASGFTASPVYVQPQISSPSQSSMSTYSRGGNSNLPPGAMALPLLPSGPYTDHMPSEIPVLSRAGLLPAVRSTGSLNASPAAHGSPPSYYNKQ